MESKALSKSKKSLAVSHFLSKFLSTFSTIRANCKLLLSLGRDPNLSFLMKIRDSIYWHEPGKQDLFERLQYCAQWADGSISWCKGREFSGFSREITIGECCHFTTALNPYVRKVASYLGRFLKALLGTPLGPAALPNLNNETFNTLVGFLKYTTSYP